MQQFVRGQKSKLSDLTQSQAIEIGINIVGKPGVTVDVSCFGLDEAGKLSDDRYFIFYNQRASPCRSVVAHGAQNGDQDTFRIDLATLPSKIKRLVFTAAIDGDATMSSIAGSRLRLLVEGDPIGEFSFSGNDFGAERALMVGELYFKDIWRFAAVGQGFNGGLSALLAHFGGEEVRSTPAPAPAPKPAPEPAAAAAPAAAPKVSLSKVTLEKQGASKAVNLKKGGGVQPIHINLNWDDPNAGKKQGWFSRKQQKADLDLGCFYRLTTGEQGVIQPLGARFGAKHGLPFIYLDKDDRSGAAVDGENLYIMRPDLIDKVVVFAMIYEGTQNFSHVKGRLRIKEEGNEIDINLTSPDPSLTFCAVCLIKKDKDAVVITKEERYFINHLFCDIHYEYGFRWAAGTK